MDRGFPDLALQSGLEFFRYELRDCLPGLLGLTSELLEKFRR